jgi:hypothetical protein
VRSLKRTRSAYYSTRTRENGQAASKYTNISGALVYIEKGKGGRKKLLLVE